MVVKHVDHTSQHLVKAIIPILDGFKRDLTANICAIVPEFGLQFSVNS
jgi:hypothetical protein